MYSKALLTLCLSGFACVSATPAATPSDAFDYDDSPANWLFTTYHNGGSITVEDGKTEFELDQVSKDVIAFSDRPKRLVRTVPSTQFEEGFTSTEEFGGVPPNGATQVKVKCEDGSIEYVDLVFELTSVKSVDADTVVYEISVLESLNVDGEPSKCIDFTVDGKTELENHSSGVFIDNVCGWIGAGIGTLTDEFDGPAGTVVGATTGNALCS